MLGVAVCAVLAGAKSLAAVGEWAADAPGPVLAALGTRRDPLTGAFRPPAEATVRRVLARVDAEALDRAIGAWLAAQQPPPPANRPPPRRAVAVDGKTLRGSGHHGRSPVHLPAVMDHTTRAILAQTDVDPTTNEITQFQPLLERLDLAGQVVTADALHTQREQAEWLVTVKNAAYLLVVKANQPTLHRQLRRLTVLADEIHAPLVLPGRTHHPFLSVSPEAAAHGMVFTSASKAWNLAGLKCAAIVTADPATRRLAERLPQELPWRVGQLGVLAGVAAFAEGEPWLEEVLGVLDHHRQYLAELLAARIPAIRYRPPEASYLAWLDCTALGLGDDPSAVFLARGRVALSPGPSFGRPGAGYARLNMGTSREILAMAVDRMAGAIES